MGEGSWAGATMQLLAIVPSAEKRGLPQHVRPRAEIYSGFINPETATPH
jgi:hypothetical protein